MKRRGMSFPPSAKTVVGSAPYTDFCRPQAFVPPRTQRPSPMSLPSTGPRRVTPATPSGTVRSHPASLSAWDPRSQPDVTAINRSATRYTCYAQRNGPGSGSSITKRSVNAPSARREGNDDKAALKVSNGPGSISDKCCHGAVAFDYRRVNDPPDRDFHPAVCTPPQAHECASPLALFRGAFPQKAAKATKAEVRILRAIILDNLIGSSTGIQPAALSAVALNQWDNHSSPDRDAGR
jgi:hypothetical protein